MPPRSKVDQMSPEDRAWFERELVRRGFSGYEELEVLVQERGYTIGKSSLQRSGSKLQQRLDRISAATEGARQIALVAPDDADNRSMAVMSMVQNDLYEIMEGLEAVADTDDAAERLELLKGVSLSISRISRARVNQSRWAGEVNARLAAEAKAAAIAGAQAEGLSAEQAERIGSAVASRVQIYLPDNGR
ncbi:phage protein Gp27 family protein [Thauera sinica]|uniref:Phage protein Gp27 family protein n=1 Tax=Thauera sinica TaxID=2665146 RepID=A0ABW1AS45_9RHOO|nr:phage protein Gp27 family protein [Thauera sp. K11]ATE60155.1 terminase [Thauera sp. K11]